MREKDIDFLKMEVTNAEQIAINAKVNLASISFEKDSEIIKLRNLCKKLKQKIGLDIALLSPEESKFFKRVYMNPPRPWMPDLDINHFMAMRHV